MATFTYHDRLFRFTFRHARHIAGWLRHVLPAHVAACLDWSTLSPASEHAVGLRLRAHVADLVFTIRLVGSDETVLLLVEHKAHHDPLLGSQVLRYVVHLRRLALRRGVPEPLVIAAVLHHGESPFRAADPVPSPERDALAHLQPHAPFLVDDLWGRSEAELRRPGMTPLAQLTHLALGHVRTFDRQQLLAAIDRWGDLLRAVEADDGPPLGEDAIAAFAWYLFEVTNLSTGDLEDLQMAFAKNLQRTETLMSTAQRLRLEGHQQGLTQGLSQGRAEALLRLLAQRFGPLPPAIAQQVRAAADDELDRWLDRVLTAPTLAAVLAG